MNNCKETGSKAMKIPIIDDNIFELEEYFYVRCSPITNGVLMPDKEIQIFIAGPNDGMFSFLQKKTYN